MRIHLRIDRVVLFDLTLFETVDDDNDDVVDLVADQLPFGFVASTPDYPEGEAGDDDE